MFAAAVAALCELLAVVLFAELQAVDPPATCCDGRLSPLGGLVVQEIVQPGRRLRRPPAAWTCHQKVAFDHLHEQPKGALLSKHGWTLAELVRAAGVAVLKQRCRLTVGWQHLVAAAALSGRELAFCRQGALRGLQHRQIQGELLLGHTRRRRQGRVRLLVVEVRHSNHIEDALQ